MNPLTGVWSGILLPSNGVVTMTISGVVSPGITGTNVVSSVIVSPPLGVVDEVTNNNFVAATNLVIEIADLADFDPRRRRDQCPPGARSWIIS